MSFESLPMFVTISIPSALYQYEVETSRRIGR